MAKLASEFHRIFSDLGWQRMVDFARLLIPPTCLQEPLFDTVTLPELARPTMSNEPQDVQTANPSRRSDRAYSPVRIALVFGLLFVSLPFLMMTVMMMGMGSMGTSMQSGMTGQVQVIFPIVGLLAFLGLVGVLDRAYRLSTIDETKT